MRTMPAFPIIMASMLFATVGEGRAAGIAVCEAYVAESMEAAQKVRDLQCGYDINHPQWSQDPEVHRRWCRDSRSESVDEENISRRKGVSWCQTCRAYANQALAAAADNERLACGFSGPRWSTDPNVHYGWCMGIRGPETFMGSIWGVQGPMEITLDPETAERDREIAECRVTKESKPKSQPSALQTRSKSSTPTKPRGGSATSAVTPAKPAAKPPVTTGTGGSSVIDRPGGASKPARTVGSGTVDFGRGGPGSGGAASPCQPGRVTDPCKRNSGVLKPGLLEGGGGFATQGPAATGTPVGGARSGSTPSGDSLRLR